MTRYRESRAIPAACEIFPVTPPEPRRAPHRILRSKPRRSCAIPSMRSRKPPGVSARSQPAPAAESCFQTVAARRWSPDFLYRREQANPSRLAAARWPNIRGSSGVAPAALRHQSQPGSRQQPDTAKSAMHRGQRLQR